MSFFEISNAFLSKNDSNTYFLITALNSAYNKCNWRVKIMTQTAVSDHEGASEFFSDHDFSNLEWGGTIIGKYCKIAKTSSAHTKNFQKLLELYSRLYNRIINFFSQKYWINIETCL